MAKTYFFFRARDPGKSTREQGFTVAVLHELYHCNTLRLTSLPLPHHCLPDSRRIFLRHTSKLLRSLLCGLCSQRQALGVYARHDNGLPNVSIS